MTVLPSVITGGLAVAPMFSLTHSAARREDSSVPVLSWQTVTVRPPSPLRTAVLRVSERALGQPSSTLDGARSIQHTLVPAGSGWKAPLHCRQLIVAPR